MNPAHILARSLTYLRGNLRPGRPPLAYVGGWLGKRNLGDEALLLATRRLFDAWSVWPFDGSRTLKRLLDEFPLTRVGLLAGGTMINRCQEYLDIAKSFTNGARDLHVFGTGVADPVFFERRGDFVNMLPQWGEFLNECGYVGVRGPRSAELLADAGVSKVEVVGDPVIAFAYDTPCSEFCPGTLGLNIGYDHGNQWGDAKLLAAEFSKLARTAIDAGWRVKWFVVFPRDMEMTRQLAEATGTGGEICAEYVDPVRFMEQVRTISVFAGMKLHATMLAACAYVPSLMVEYDPKCMDFMRSIGQGGSVVRTDRFNAAEVWQTLSAWNDARTAESRAIFEAVSSLRRKQSQKARELTGVMQSNFAKN